MAGKFSMTATTLVDLGKRTSTESDDLGTLVKQLIAAAEPLAQTFNGPAKASFNNFKGKADSIAGALNSALAGICGSIAGQNVAFVEGAEEGASVHQAAQGSANFSAESTLRSIGPTSA